LTSLLKKADPTALNTEVQLLRRRLSRPRAALVVAVAAALAVVVAANPSFAGSFLTSQKAAHLYLTNKKGNALYLKKKAAGNVYVKKADAPLTPIVGIAAGTAPFEATATTAGYIPTAFTSFATKGNASTVITFSGQATCVAEKPTVELACPIQILVDGQSTGKVNFAPATVASPKTAALIHTVTQTTVLGKGGHTVAVQYAGAAKVSFALRGWNLAVQAYPEAAEALPTAETPSTGAAPKYTGQSK
jgi:phenylpyruvate tautomerase PptA (4-oxalocrotonate tautomerase family)